MVLYIEGGGVWGTQMDYKNEGCVVLVYHNNGNARKVEI